jgi:hypothetical protein
MPYTVARLQIEKTISKSKIAVDFLPHKKKSHFIVLAAFAGNCIEIHFRTSCKCPLKRSVLDSLF